MKSSAPGACCMEHKCCFSLKLIAIIVPHLPLLSDGHNCSSSSTVKGSAEFIFVPIPVPVISFILESKAFLND